MIQAGTPVVVTSGSLRAEPGVVVGAERPFVVVEVPRLGTRCMVLAEDLEFVVERRARQGVLDAAHIPRRPT